MQKRYICENLGMNNNYCVACGQLLLGRSNKKYCSSRCASWFHSRLPKNRARQKEYRKTHPRREYQKAWMRQYRNSVRGKLRIAAMKNSEKYKEKRRAYNISDKGRETALRNRQKHRQQRRLSAKAYYQLSETKEREKLRRKTQEYKRQKREGRMTPHGRAMRVLHEARRRAIKLNVVGGKTTTTQMVLQQMNCWHKRCYICGGPFQHVDHIVPLQPRPGEPQGTHLPENLAPSCMACNLSKHNTPLEIWLPQYLQSREFCSHW